MSKEFILVNRQSFDKKQWRKWAASARLLVEFSIRGRVLTPPEVRLVLSIVSNIKGYSGEYGEWRQEHDPARFWNMLEFHAPPANLQPFLQRISAALPDTRVYACWHDPDKALEEEGNAAYVRGELRLLEIVYNSMRCSVDRLPPSEYELPRERRSTSQRAKAVQRCLYSLRQFVKRGDDAWK